ncbi:MAG: RNA 2'-phosphotransferase [Methanomassiliicoccaceae archaeon]|jgi:putative RNA 2'-phosphotransferase|nr:RNA 2'-phosphotransferase [Methanomassiliicoccaceae archaeon]
MMKECEAHGYYRDDICPVCGEPGKFLMNDSEVERLGRTIAGILRHGKFSLKMDDQGFVSMREIIYTVKENNNRMHWLRPHHIIALVETDPKGRYQTSGDMVRATYGHSIPLELDLPTEDVPAELFFPTTAEEVDIILEVGLLPSDRSMVHLSLTYDDAMRAGKVRVDNPIILVIDADAVFEAGYEIGKAGKTVFLSKYIPPECLEIADENDH